MSDDFDLSSTERLINLINKDNVNNQYGIVINDRDVTFSEPVDVPEGDKNTEITLTSIPNTRTVGSVTVRYNRLDLNGLKDLADIPLTIEEGNLSTSSVIEQLNNVYGCNISVDELEAFSVEDIDFEGGLITFRAKSDSLAWINEIELLVKLDQDLLSNVFINTDLRGLSWPFVFEGILTQLIYFYGNITTTTEGQIFELGNELVVCSSSGFHRIDLAPTPPVVNETYNLYLVGPTIIPEGDGETAVTHNSNSLRRVGVWNSQTGSKVLTEVNWQNNLPSGFAPPSSKTIGKLFEYKGNYSIIVYATYSSNLYIAHAQYDKETLTPIVEKAVVYDTLPYANSGFLSVVDGTDLYILPDSIHSVRAEGSIFFKVYVLDLDSNTVKREFFLPYGLKPNSGTSTISMTVFKGKLVVMSYRSSEYHIYASDDKGETWYEVYSGTRLAGYQPTAANLKVFDDRLLIVCGSSSIDSRIIELM